jgi:tRNA threonylcarbamoyl adenosine modification protein YeaZ
VVHVVPLPTPAPPPVSPQRVTLAIEATNPAVAGAGVALGVPSPASPTQPAPNLNAHNLPLRILAHQPMPAPSAAPPGGDQRPRDWLIPAIDQALRDARLTPRAISTVAVSVGPGGYTSVRVAVTVARFIAEATGACCIPIPTTHVAAVRFAATHAHPTTHPTTHPSTLFVALASKGDTAYIQPFSITPDIHPHVHPHVHPIAEPALADAAAFAALLDRARALPLTHPRPSDPAIDPQRPIILLADEHLPPAIAALAHSQGVPIQPPVLDPIACLAASLIPNLNNHAVDPLELAPIYPREPEAVTKWRALHPDR